MPLGFLSSPSSPFDEIVERATAEVLPCENWDLILSINDKINESGVKGAKACLLSLKKRLNHRDPHVILLSLSLLDSCVCNCKVFQQEAGCKEFLNELKSKAKGSNAKIAEKSREVIKKWVDEYKMMNFAPLYNELKNEGYDFTSSDNKKAKNSQIALLESKLKEEEDLNKAIQMSLKEQTARTSAQTYGSTTLYPMASGSAKQSTTSGRRVKALYDFEAAEENELTFRAGDIITITDDSDINWWKGSNSVGEGLFPASFVTADLSIDVEQLNSMEKKKSVQFDENVKVETIERKSVETPTINSDKLSRCLEMLQNADPTGDRLDPPELLDLEQQSVAMGPLIDAELANNDKQINQLSDVNAKLMDALNLYHTTMSDASALTNMTFPYVPSSPQHSAQSVLSQMPPSTPYQPFPGQISSTPQTSYTTGNIAPS
uniref:Signal transducing adapter molecule 1 n=1 Tax=Romanomermis culicivorax TaxID=13658 RepID=A0A915JJA5_ROMCU